MTSVCRLNTNRTLWRTDVSLHSLSDLLCCCFWMCFSFLFVIEHMMPLCMVISWVYSVAMMIQHIVAEKEHRLKEVRLRHCTCPFFIHRLICQEGITFKVFRTFFSCYFIVFKRKAFWGFHVLFYESCIYTFSNLPDAFWSAAVSIWTHTLWTLKTNLMINS